MQTNSAYVYIHPNVKLIIIQIIFTYFHDKTVISSLNNWGFSSEFVWQWNDSKRSGNYCKCQVIVYIIHNLTLQTKERKELENKLVFKWEIIKYLDNWVSHFTKITQFSSFKVFNDSKLFICRVDLHHMNWETFKFFIFTKC